MPEPPLSTHAGAPSTADTSAKPASFVLKCASLQGATRLTSAAYCVLYAPDNSRIWHGSSILKPGTATTNALAALTNGFRVAADLGVPYLTSHRGGPNKTRESRGHHWGADVCWVTGTSAAHGSAEGWGPSAGYLCLYLAAVVGGWQARHPSDPVGAGLRAAAKSRQGGDKDEASCAGHRGSQC